MKMFLAVAFISLVVVQFCLLPIAVNGGDCPFDSVVTLPATNITINAATLNGIASFQLLDSNLKPNGVVLTSLQYVLTV